MNQIKVDTIAIQNNSHVILPLDRLKSYNTVQEFNITTLTIREKLEFYMAAISKLKMTFI